MIEVISMHASGGPRPEPSTLTRLFFEAIEKYDLPAAYKHKLEGKYVPIAHRDVLRRARHVSLGLGALGVARGDRVGIMSENRPEWAIADWACLGAGMTDVPIYPTLPAEQIVHPLNDSGAVVLFVSTPAQAEKAASVRDKFKTIKRIISFTHPAPAGVDMTFCELEASGKALDSEAKAAEWKAGALAVKPDDLATLIYTSGTTGLPKGVMLTHDNIASNVIASRNKVPVSVGEEALSFLPLSHIFERMGDYLFFACGVSVAYAENIDAVPLNLTEVRPHYVMSVPRLFEKMYARVLENALSGGFIKARIFRWAAAVADRWADVTLAGGTPRGALAWQYGIAQKLVFSKLQERTGGRIKYFISGGAPLAPSINKFFYAAGIKILEGYGLTETSPVITVNGTDFFRIGTVGKPIAGVEVRIAEDGEILTRGPHVMKGYFNNPTATAEAIGADGWFATGDIGVLEDGFLRITDRKKDLIVTAGGKNIAPQPIENQVKLNKFVSQAVMIGDKRKYTVLLVVPNWDQLDKWAAAKNLLWTNRRELLAMPLVHDKMEREVRKQLVGLASFETPKKIGLLEHDFSIERGELTPKLSVRRKVVDQSYKELIDSLYAGDHPHD
ncbi:MAG TPA: long-chain fatty acid--CoA ligase [Gemmatimonadaceae bacterium]|nr:long-chain fatty acid--CoA ligase [Gemmatimonadaceae bacterium]